MASVSVTELKAQLSRYLRMVRRGSEVQILERGVPIARLVGLESTARGSDRKRLERLEELGFVRRGKGDLSWLLEEPPPPIKAAGLAAALETDRGDRM
jgi:prevent-host-death family protein